MRGIIQLEKTMKLPVKLALISAASSLLVTAAFAGAPEIYGLTPANSVSLSVDGGYGVLSTPGKNIEDPDALVTGASNSKGSFAGGFSVGYNHALRPNLLVGAEFGWDYNGQSKYTEDYLGGSSSTLKVSSTDFRLLATSTYLFANGLNVFAKGGAARVDQKLDFDGPYYSYEDSIQQYKPMVAGGVGYQFRMLNLYVQYSHIFAKDASDFNDFINNNGKLTEVVSVDTIKAGIGVNIAI